MDEHDSRKERTEKKATELENRTMERSRLTDKERLRDLRVCNERCSIHARGVPAGEAKQGGQTKKYLKKK